VVETAARPGATPVVAGGDEVAEWPADARNPAQCGTMRGKEWKGKLP
jgi:hypothetical protein